jgi:hypothetical protein
MSVVHEPVEDAVSDSGVADLLVPLGKPGVGLTRDRPPVTPRRDGIRDRRDPPVHPYGPAGTEEFIHSLEQSTRRRLTPLKGGRPRKSVTETNQGTLDL